MKVIAMNRKDRLEEFIFERKDALDALSPSKDLWSRIESELDNGGPEEPSPENKKYAWSIWSILAALAMTAYVFYNMGSQRSEEKMMLFAEVDELENYYEYRSAQMIKTVSNKVDLLQNPDLEEINNFINEIKADLEGMPKESEEKALHSLMESYQTKLMIIERVLMYYENTESKNSNEYDI